METITMNGVIDPVVALDLRVRLHELTDGLRPAITVDLSQVRQVHLAGVATLVSAARRAERRGGCLRVLPPEEPAARREFERTGWFVDGATASTPG